MVCVPAGNRCTRAARGRCRAIGLVVMAAGLLALVGCRAGVTRGDILYANALERLAAGDTAAALAGLEAARYESPDDARIHALLAALLASDGSFEARHRADECWRQAIALDPGSAAYAAGLGELLQRQGFWHEGHGSLRRAVEIDPHLQAAWFHLGTSYLRDYLDTLDSDAWRDSALACNERALALDSLDAAARYRAAILAFQRGDRTRGRRLAAGGPRAGPAAARFRMLRTALEYRDGRDSTAAVLLDSLLAALPAPARDSLLDPRRLLAPESVPPCDPCSAVQRDSFALALWHGLDRTPATVLNERLLEHVARIVEADFCFAVPVLRLAGRDSDRGDIYVRYGAPDWMHRDILENAPAWRWGFGDLGGQSEEVLFVDSHFNGSYPRVRRGAGGDYMHVEFLQRTPQLWRRNFGPLAPGWEHAVYRFRARDGRPALEVAYAYASTVPLDSVRLEVAAWADPLAPAVARRVSVDPRALHRRSDGRAVGRFRIVIPCTALEVGLQASAWCQSGGTSARHPEWWAASRDSVVAACCDTSVLAMSDLVPAAALRRGDGGPFDLGGTTVVPSLQGTVGKDGALHLYFEVYPGREILSARRPLEISYRVESLPPRQWRFRDQFSAAARARRTERSAVQSTFRLRPRREVEPQPLSIDVRQLEAGDYELVVEVRGPGGERVERRTRFALPERPRPR